MRSKDPQRREKAASLVARMRSVDMQSIIVVSEVDADEEPDGIDTSAPKLVEWPPPDTKKSKKPRKRKRRRGTRRGSLGQRALRRADELETVATRSPDLSVNGVRPVAGETPARVTHDLCPVRGCVLPLSLCGHADELDKLKPTHRVVL